MAAHKEVRRPAIEGLRATDPFGRQSQVRRDFEEVQPSRIVSAPSRGARLIEAWSTSGLLLLALSVLSGCDLPGKPDPANRPRRPGEIVDFATLFAHNCSGCHGAQGRLGPAPPLNDPLFLAICADATIETTIAAGRSGTLMPSFAIENGGDLTRQQIKALVAGIRSTWGAAAAAADPPASPPTYLATDSAALPSGDATRGAELFAATCARCHGEDGGGGPKAGPLRDPAFLALVSDQFLRRIVITGRPDLGMPDYRREREGADRPFDDQEISDVVTLLGSWREGATPVDVTVGARKTASGGRE